MAEICSHINQSDANVKYGAILHAARKTYKSEMTFT